MQQPSVKAAVGARGHGSLACPHRTEQFSAFLVEDSKLLGQPGQERQRQDRMTPARKVLSEIFGYTAFRDGQEDVVDHVAAGGDALVLMPTGWGKSLCYQIPSLVRPGTGIVVSPLIALMQDQVACAGQLGVRAAFSTPRSMPLPLGHRARIAGRQSSTCSTSRPNA
jgi:hypothetical protein